MKARKKDIVSSSSKNFKKKETVLKKNNLNGMQEKQALTMNEINSSSKLEKAKQNIANISKDTVAYTVKKGTDKIHDSLEKSDSEGVRVSSQTIKGAVKTSSFIKEKQEDHKLRKKEIQHKLQKKEFVLKKEINNIEQKLSKNTNDLNNGKVSLQSEKTTNKLTKTIDPKDKIKLSQKNVILKNKEKNIKLSPQERKKVEKVLAKKKKEINKIKKNSKLKTNISAVKKNAVKKTKEAPTKIVQKSVVSYKNELEKGDSEGVKVTLQSASTLAKTSKKLSKFNDKQLKASSKLKKGSIQTKNSATKFQKKKTLNLSKENQKRLQKKRLVKKSMLANKNKNPYFASNVISRVNQFFKKKPFSLSGVKKEIGKKLSLIFSGSMGIVVPVLLVLSFFLLLSGLLGISTSPQYEEQVGGGKQLSPQVERYRTLVEKEASAQGMEEYVALILAIIQVESNGMGNDIMQSSESAGYPPNHFGTPEASVQQGIKYIKQIVNVLKAYKKDYEKNMKLIAQSYNYGIAFASYVGNRGGEYSIDVSEEYSKNVVAPSLGNTTGRTYPYINEVSTSLGKPYLYFNGGNFMYGDLVNQYLGFGGSGEYVLPVDSPNISSPFGYRTSPLGGQGEFHRGLDFANPFGSTIKAIQGGKIITAEYHYSWGNHVVILHEDGKVSLYAHQSQILVKVGDIVQTGQPIGKIGSTGDSTGPHLHLEIAKSTDLSQGNLLDPAIVLGIN